MPFVQIHLRAGKSPEYTKAISQGVQQAMIATINVPKDDYFHAVHEYSEDQLFIDPAYPNTERSSDAVIIHITLSLGRSDDMKQALYRTIAENLHQSPGLRKDDVMIVLAENNPVNWSFTKGLPRQL